MKRLFVFGFGFSAAALARILLPEGWQIGGTCRSESKAGELRALNVAPVLFDGSTPLAPTVLDGVTHILASIPPDPDDPILVHHAGLIASSPDLTWLGYLSTTSVYGVDDGSWVAEDTPARPKSQRGERRLAAERAWQAMPLPAHVFRLSGIYGPGRSVFDTIRAGRAQRVVKPGHAFNRIHVADIATTVRCSIERPDPGRIYNLADDLPAPSSDLVTYACGLLNVAPPPEVNFEDAAFSPMAREFWSENKRVRNMRIKNELGVRLAYPTWREGLDAIFAAER